MVNIAIGLRLLLFYVLPGAFALYFLLLVLTAKKPKAKRTAAVGFTLLTALLAFFVFNSYNGDKQWERSEVGTYQLTNYPDCQPCVLELLENNLFLVKQHGFIREAGKWRFESGQDYWITYLNENDQLGSGNYCYTSYQLKYPKP